MQKNQIMIATGVIIAVLAFLGISYFLTSSPQQQQAKVYPEVSKILATDHVSWSPDKKKIVVEYSDLQCPACKAFHDGITQFEQSPQGKDVMSKVTFVYRHYPLEQVHQHALVAAYAAEAASKQGKFEQWKDYLFDHQSEWESLSDSDVIKKFQDYAKSMGINVDQFNKDMNSSDVKKIVSDDELSGNQYGVDATPTFYLNGEKVENLTSVQDFLDRLVAFSK